MGAEAVGSDLAGNGPFPATPYETSPDVLVRTRARRARPGRCPTARRRRRRSCLEQPDAARQDARSPRDDPGAARGSDRDPTADLSRHRARRTAQAAAGATDQLRAIVLDCSVDELLERPPSAMDRVHRRRARTGERPGAVAGSRVARLAAFTVPGRMWQPIQCRWFGFATVNVSVRVDTSLVLAPTRLVIVSVTLRR
jgi:hypothetical protein